jgi:transposase-like protein
MAAIRRNQDFSSVWAGDDKLQVAKLFAESKMTQRAFAKAHNIGRKTLRTYIRKKKLLEQEKVNHFTDGRSGGRPSYLDLERTADLRKALKAARANSGDAMKFANFPPQVLAAKNEHDWP